MALSLVETKVSNIVGCNELQLRGFVANPQVAADYLAGDTNGGLLTHFAIIVYKDMLWIGIDRYDIEWDNGKSGFFVNFPYSRVGDRLTEFHGATGKRPQVIVGSTMKEYLAGTICHNH